MSYLKAYRELKFQYQSNKGGAEKTVKPIASLYYFGYANEPHPDITTLATKYLTYNEIDSKVIFDALVNQGNWYDNMKTIDLSSESRTIIVKRYIMFNQGYSFYVLNCYNVSCMQLIVYPDPYNKYIEEVGKNSYISFNTDKDYYTTGLQIKRYDVSTITTITDPLIKTIITKLSQHRIDVDILIPYSMVTMLSTACENYIGDRDTVLNNLGIKFCKECDPKDAIYQVVVQFIDKMYLVYYKTGYRYKTCVVTFNQRSGEFEFIEK